VKQSEIEHGLRLEICKVGHQLYQRGYVVACQGNLSVRLSADEILVTPTGVCKGDLSPKDLLVTDSGGAVIRGTTRPTSELQMHLLYYRLRPDVRAVCHAHPPTATGFASAGRALEPAVVPEVVTSLGSIPLAAYGTPGTRELCSGLESLVPKHNAILLENHGVVTSAQDLMTAYYRMETVEQCARILLTAETLGGPHLLTYQKVQKLIAATSDVVSLDQTMELPLTSEVTSGRLRQPRPETGILSREGSARKSHIHVGKDARSFRE
jgi:L-fuculose-phosphate aldolase